MRGRSSRLASATFDSAGNRYVADADNRRIRQISTEIVSIFGTGLGPQDAVPGIVREPGILDTTLADTQVLFNGTPVPLLSAQYNRINVQAPYELAGRNSAQVEIRKGGVLKTRLVTAGAGQTAASNEDGTANSLGNPALRGSIVTMFATGEGQTRPVGISLALEPRPFNLRPGPQRARWE